MKKEITIGLFTDVFYPMTDGVVLVVDNYAKRLAKMAKVIVFAPSYRGQKYDDSKLNYEVIRCKSLKVPFIDYSLPIPKMDREFKKIVNNYHLDIVHIHSPFTIGEAGICYAKDHHIPCVGTMHSQYKQDFMRAIRNEKIAQTLTKKLIKVYNQCDECWAVNKEVARIFYEDYGYKKLPRVMNNATEMLPVDDYIASCNRINKRHNLHNEKVFLFVGRLNALKNIFFIVDALFYLQKINPNLKYKMFFIGTGQDEEVLKKKIKEKKLDSNVILLGKITDRNLLADYYARSDLFLFPSLYDASSIVQIEAASQKTPGLFLEKAATTSTVTDNVDGFICPNNPMEYAKKINMIISDEKKLQEVSTNAYHNLYKNWDNFIIEVYNRYLELIEEKK